MQQLTKQADFQVLARAKNTQTQICSEWQDNTAKNKLNLDLGVLINLEFLFFVTVKLSCSLSVYLYLGDLAVKCLLCCSLNEKRMWQMTIDMEPYPTVRFFYVNLFNHAVEVITVSTEALVALTTKQRICSITESQKINWY